jgi:hypothetical protein
MVLASASVNLAKLGSSVPFAQVPCREEFRQGTPEGLRAGATATSPRGGYVDFSHSPITIFASVEAFTFFPLRILRIVLRSSRFF